MAHDSPATDPTSHQACSESVLLPKTPPYLNQAGKDTALMTELKSRFRLTNAEYFANRPTSLAKWQCSLSHF